MALPADSPLGSDPTPTPAAAAEPGAPLSSWWTLALLVALALYTLIDRQIISLQVDALRQELKLSDFQIGLVQGVSVALFTAVAGYPIAWLADRFDRRIVLACSIALWSISMALAGSARSFEELFIASALIGIGEIGLLPIAYALIPELFRGRQRHLANSTLILGGRLGMGLVIAFSGWLIHGIDLWREALPELLQGLPTWRLAFLATALPGLIFVPLILWAPISRPVRATVPAAGPADAQRASRRAPPVLPFLRRQWPAFVSFYLGVGCMVFGIGGVLAFAPAVAMRQMGASPLVTGNGMGAATFAATLAGFFIAQVGYRRLEPWFGLRLPAAMLLGAAGLGATVAVGMLFTQNTTQLFIGVGLYLTAVMAGTLLYPTALQDITPAPMRARLVSIGVTTNIVLGSLGPVAVGALSDQWKGQADALLTAMVAVAVAAMLLSAALLVPVLRRFPATVTAARDEEARLGAAP